MHRFDPAPPETPTTEQQRDALQKGLGRAKQWARAGKLADESLLEACLEDQRHDTQLEETRAEWLWGMVQEAGAAERFRAPILHAVQRLDDERSACQLVQLAFYYAKGGDEAFLARLREIVEAKPSPEELWLAEGEIIELDGWDGFLLAAKSRGRRLASQEWEWSDNSFIEDAIEQFGEAEVTRCLDETDDPDLIRFRETWRDQIALNPEEEGSYEEMMRARPVEKILSIARTEEDHPVWFSGWGRYADEVDLEKLREHLWFSEDPRVIKNLLPVFFKVPLQNIDRRWFDLCRHPDSLVQHRAFSVLKNNAHPLIREFAVAELSALPFIPNVVGLFIKNYQRGDEAKILEAIELPDEVNALHWLLRDVIELLEQNEEADRLPLALLTYTETPCENCRYYAVKLLLGQNLAPEWLIEECHFDSCTRTVELIEALDPNASE